MFTSTFLLPTFLLVVVIQLPVEISVVEVKQY